MTKRIRLMMAWMMVLSLTIGSGAFSAMAQEGTPAAAAADQLFSIDGIDAPIVASAPVDDASSIDGSLLLERIELPVGASQSPRTTASAELYYVESGALSIQDDFGFGTTIPAENGLTLNAGTTFTLANQGTDPAVVLRLRLSEGAAASDTGVAGATPTDLPGEGAPASDEHATVLVQMPISGLELGAAQIYLSRVTFASGAATGEQGHAGPIGLYVETGALNVVSPSGFQGTIGAGQGVSLPAETPLQASTADAEAVVLIVGLSAADAPFGAVTPEPVATTEVPEPSTPEATADVESSEPVLFEADAANSGLSHFEGGAGWNTLPDMLIADGSVDTSIYVPFDPKNVANYAIEAEVQAPILGETVRFALFARQSHSSDIAAAIDAGWGSGDPDVTIEVAGDELVSAGLGMDDEWHTYRLEVEGNEIRFLVDGTLIVVTHDDRLLDPGRMGIRVSEHTHLNVRAVRVVALGNVGSAPADAASEAAAPGVGGSAAITDIQGTVASLSPPDGLAAKEQGSLGAEEITATFSDPADASRFFNDWGWQENAFVYYEPPNGGSSADGLVYVDVGLHRFASAGGAAQALTYLADTRRDQLALGDVEIAPLGEQTRALMGATDTGTEASVYSRVGGVVVRVSVMSVGVDPLALATTLVQGMVGALQASAASAAAPASVPVDLGSLRPGPGDVPAQLVVTAESNRTLEEVAANYQNPAEVTSLFTGWGWQGNVTRAWQLPAGSNVGLDQINGVYVSIHMFDNPQGAASALDLSLIDQSVLTGAWEVDSPGLGDYSRALWGQETYGNEITLLVQRGNLLIRVSAAQLEGDPTPAAANIVQGIIGRAG